MLYSQYQLPVIGGTITVSAYIPDVIPGLTDQIARPAIVIAGGGGYAYVSPRESEPVALRMAAYGINAYTVQYRVSPEVRYPVPAQDLAAAVAWVRANAALHHTDPARIGIMGFSAGAHAAASLGVLWHQEEFSKPLGLTPDDVRPNTMVLCYPVITGGPYAHRRSFANITGSEDLSVHDALSLEKQVTNNAPTTFLWHTWDDQAVPVENTLLMASALRAAGVSCELHIYQHGPHGLSLCDETTAGINREMIQSDDAVWFDQAVHFLKRN